MQWYEQNQQSDQRGQPGNNAQPPCQRQTATAFQTAINLSG
jgi:hypothetical protein